ncbi:hypothetical protein DFH09DRAFT_1366260 [Mycena vulgaris]|nr:hypothetical protein DFH09DRAFT_1366260 [Mycena vulgaris]
MRIRMLRVLLLIALAGELLVVLRLASCCRFLRLRLLRILGLRRRTLLFDLVERGGLDSFVFVRDSGIVLLLREDELLTPAPRPSMRCARHEPRVLLRVVLLLLIRSYAQFLRGLALRRWTLFLDAIDYSLLLSERYSTLLPCTSFPVLLPSPPPLTPLFPDGGRHRADHRRGPQLSARADSLLGHQVRPSLPRLSYPESLLRRLLAADVGTDDTGAAAELFLEGTTITGKLGQPEYRDVVPMFGIVNEALKCTIGREQLIAFYLEAHNMIRWIMGDAAGNGPFMSIHDGFQGVASWAGFLPGSPNDAPIATSEDAATAGGTWPASACSARTAFGVTVAGELSNGYNDCGMCLTGMNRSQHYGGDCALWEDSSTSNASVKAGVREFALASMDIGPAVAGVVRPPLWSYQLGLEGGGMPTDPRTAVGKCAAIGVLGEQFPGTYSARQTGSASTGTIATAATAQFGQWPPARDDLACGCGSADVAADVCGDGERVDADIRDTERDGGAAQVTVTVSVGNGWFNAQDTAPVMTAVAGCTYPDAWGAVSSSAPTALCTSA